MELTPSPDTAKYFVAPELGAQEGKARGAVQGLVSGLMRIWRLQFRILTEAKSEVRSEVRYHAYIQRSDGHILQSELGGSSMIRGHVGEYWITFNLLDHLVALSPEDLLSLTQGWAVVKVMCSDGDGPGCPIWVSRRFQIHSPESSTGRSVKRKWHRDKSGRPHKRRRTTGPASSEIQAAIALSTLA